MHIPYEERVNHQSDFRVRYTLKIDRAIFQGYRSDFWYEGDDQKPESIYMIWPEFEDENGNVIIDDRTPIAATGTARMWIIMRPMRTYHKSRIKVGLKGYFHEGSKASAECTIIEILGLHTNPSEPLPVW